MKLNEFTMSSHFDCSSSLFRCFKVVIVLLVKNVAEDTYYVWWCLFESLLSQKLLGSVYQSDEVYLWSEYNPQGRSEILTAQQSWQVNGRCDVAFFPTTNPRTREHQPPLILPLLIMIFFLEQLTSQIIRHFVSFTGVYRIYICVCRR